MNSDDALGSAAQQLSEKPLLSEFPRRPGNRASAPPQTSGVFRGLAIRWQYVLDVVDHAEPNPNSILVPARGLEPRTLGLKDRCSTRLSYAGY